MSVVTFTKKGKVYKNIVPRKIIDDKKIKNDEECIKKIIGDVSNLKVICDVYLNQKIEYNGGVYLIVTSEKTRNQLKIAYQNYMDNNDLFYLNYANKKVNDFKDDALEYKIKDKNDNLIVTISKQENEIIFNKIKKIMNKKVYDSCSYIVRLRELNDFDKFSIKEQISILNNLLIALTRKIDNCKLPNYSISIFRPSINVTNDQITIIYESPTGLFVKKKKI